MVILLPCYFNVNPRRDLTLNMTNNHVQQLLFDPGPRITSKHLLIITHILNNPPRTERFHVGAHSKVLKIRVLLYS